MFDTVEDISQTIKEVRYDLTGKTSILAGLKGTKGKSLRLSQGIVWVTDLLNPRRTYFKEKFPEVELEIPLERRELMWAGSDFHKVFGQAVYPEAYQEWYINKEGIAGRVDIFKDFPIEVKRTTTPLEEDILTSRPENIEQLGMYSALIGIDRGHLIYYVCNSNGGEIRAYEVVFKDLTAIWKEMKARRELLLDAWTRDDPSGLPMCTWQGKGCECEIAKKCDCASLGNGFDYNIVDQVSKFTLIQGEGDRLSKLISMYMTRPRLNISFWDILFPRKYYFRVSGDVKPEPVFDPSQLRWRNEKRSIENAIKHGSGSEFETIYSEVSDERLAVLNYRGKPTIISQPTLRSPLSLDKNAISKFLGDAVKILGMGCALTGSDSGRLITYYQKVPDEASRLAVYNIKFTDEGLASYRKLMDERLNKIRLATGSGNFSVLPTCPKVKCEYRDWTCPYLNECGGA